MQFWQPEWQALVCTGSRSILAIIVEMGFDSAVLDRVDAYGDWPLRPSAKDGYGDVGHATSPTKGGVAKPSFLLVPQNAEHLIQYTRYIEAIDGLNKESLLTGLSGEGINNQAADVRWSLSHLRRAQTSGIVTFGTEYLAGRQEDLAVSEQLRALGFKPFIARRQLDRLPSAPGSR